MRLTISVLFLTLSMLFTACSPKANDAHAPVVWKLDNTQKIGGLETTIIGGAPQIASGGVLQFDGKAQGLLLPSFPIAGCAAFTIELEIFPEAGGEFEQRFFHGGTSEGPRTMIELRSNPDGSWYLDSHIRDVANHRMTLIDAKKTHASGRWYTVKLVYDGKTMSHYIDGALEGEATGIAVAPMPESPVSLGVRQNKVCWFKGMLREVRFWPEARR